MLSFTFKSIPLSLQSGNCQWMVRRCVPAIRAFSSSAKDSDSSTSAQGTISASQSTLIHGHQYDLIVIGSGPAGQKCAINAAKQKKRVAIIDRSKSWGGNCIHTSTVPSKTLREAIMYLTGYRQRGFYGKGFIRRDDISSHDIMERVKKVEQWETATVLDQLYRNRIHTIHGTARFIDSNRVEVLPEPIQPVTGTGALTAAAHAAHSPSHSHSPSSAASSNSENNVLSASKFLIACGTRPARNDLYPFDSPLVFDSDEILKRPTWDSIRHLIVIGGGVIALEYASMFNSLPGCRVTIIDEKPHILDFIDSEIVQTLRHTMNKSGAVFRLGEKVVAVDASGEKVRVTLESGKTVIGDSLFYAVGRQANSDSLNLPSAGVEIGKRGLIQVNEYFQTNQPHIYAAGDVIGFPALASCALEQGRLASQHMFAIGQKMPKLFPYGIYTIPEISVVGQSEQELTKNKIPYEIGIAKFEETAKGQMLHGQSIEGFLKLIFCPHSHKILGCAAIGDNATEIIHIPQVVMQQNGVIEYFRDSVFNYPTFCEALRIAALDGLNRIDGMKNKEQK